MAAASAATLRAPRTGQPYPTDMPFSSAEWAAWLRDNAINANKMVHADLQSYSSLAAGTTFASVAIPGNFCRLAGEGFFIRAWGNTAATVNNKTVGLSFGGQALIGSGALAANNKPWIIEATVFYTGGQSWEFFCTGFANGAVITPTEGQQNSIDPTAAITILTTCTAATADGDALQKGFTVTYFDQFSYVTQN